MLIDTHCHLSFPDFDRDRDDAIDRAKKIGVTGIIDVGSSIEGTRRAVELARARDIVYATVGVHPHEAKSVTDEVISEFRKLAKEAKVVAVGEVGLDFYRNLSPKEEQESAFRKFIRLARDLGLPLIIHAREAARDTIRILDEEKGAGLRGVMHCFSGDERFLEECLGLGLYVSFTCNLTFKNAEGLRSVAKKVPVEKLLLETDAPYLAPQKFRGKRNEPAYLVYLVDQWADITGLSRNDISRITTHNANALFKLHPAEGSRIAYEIRDSLYLNITNRCTNNCNFCIRNETDFVKGHNLMLEKEPSAEEIVKAAGDPAKYKEIVFCGYGEPTMRLDIVEAVAKELKAKGAAVRLVTNGHGDLINSRPIAGELAGLIDRVSISLNVDTEERYNEICVPKFGRGTHKHVIDFITDCVAHKIDTEVTCLDLEGVDITKCEELAKSLGARFRLRRYGVTG
ncbi:MAG: YchF/TatD family DNA exonuclease [Candidatus Omnitrophica bacterium]|nr:YchF/TatD family DNA exonuclease [Candidatus Omnitrophota bacterium]